ncbi:MAG: OadG family protein [Dehalococcoidia bacterium]
MDSGLIDGAVLAGMGVTIVFATLVILMAVILLMGRVFPEKGPGPFPPAEGTESVVSEEGEGPPEGEVVAAIALALSLAQPESGRLGLRMGAPSARRTNLWAIYGRQQIMDSRGRARQQW